MFLASTLRTISARAHDSAIELLLDTSRPHIQLQFPIRTDGNWPWLNPWDRINLTTDTTTSVTRSDSQSFSTKWLSVDDEVKWRSTWNMGFCLYTCCLILPIKPVFIPDIFGAPSDVTPILSKAAQVHTHTHELLQFMCHADLHDLLVLQSLQKLLLYPEWRLITEQYRLNHYCHPVLDKKFQIPVVCFSVD